MQRSLIILLLLPLLFSGCSVPVHVYIRNLTDATREIRILMDHADAAYAEYLYTYSIIEPNFSVYEGFDRKLTPGIDEEGRTALRVPAHSTLLLERTMNFHSRHRSIMLNGTDIISKEGTFKEGYSKMKEGPSKYTIWYDLK